MCGISPHLDLTDNVGPSHTTNMDVAKIIAEAGGASKLARALGLHHTTVLGWAQVPPKHVAAIAALTKLERHQIRPDLWEAPQAGVAA